MPPQNYRVAQIMPYCNRVLSNTNSSCCLSYQLSFLIINTFIFFFFFFFKNQSKTMLIERVVECIGCEKAIKLFKDTQEVERHGGMYTKERERR